MDKKLQKGIVAVLIANLVNVAFSLATNFLLPKYLSIESYAGIKEFQLYVSYVGLFHLGFVDGIYLKYGGKTLGKDVDKEFSTDLSTMCIFQTITTIAVLIVAIILRDRILAFFAISILPQNMSNYFKFLYQATGEFDLYGKAMNLTTISTFALNMVLLFVLRTDSVFWYIAGSLFPDLDCTGCLFQKESYASKRSFVFIQKLSFKYQSRIFADVRKSIINFSHQHGSLVCKSIDGYAGICTIFLCS